MELTFLIGNLMWLGAFLALAVMCAVSAMRKFSGRDNEVFYNLNGWSGPTETIAGVIFTLISVLCFAGFARQLQIIIEGSI